MIQARSSFSADFKYLVFNLICKLVLIMIIINCLLFPKTIVQNHLKKTDVLTYAPILQITQNEMLESLLRMNNY